MIELGRKGGRVGGSESLRITLLGGFRIRRGPRTIEEDEWHLKKAASLLKLLALVPEHRLHRERVMDLLWPNLDARAAANNLRYALHHARRMLEPRQVTTPSCLRMQDDHVALAPVCRFWVDVEAFKEAAATARRARAPAAYRVAVDLYGGDLLPGDRYEDWAEGRRAELRTLYLALLVEMAGLYEARGEFEPAIEALGKVIQTEPAHEEAHVALMRLYAISGRRGEAIGQYQQLREVLRRDLAVVPAPDSRHVYEEILAGRSPPSRSPAAGPSPRDPPGVREHNLPQARTSFVGRESEIAEVRRTLAMTALLTLTGAGGSGKTRLALEAARDLVGAYPDGVWFVGLAPLADVELVPQAVASVLGVREQHARPLLDTLAAALEKKKMLLVLDNCEHLIDGAARLADTLLDHCPGVRILSTSREPLGVAGEMSWPVPPLSLPDPGHPPTVDELEGYESARLFVERALLRGSAFALTAENAPAVAEICKQLDGIPLAIELAAARVGALSVEQISARLSDSLELLTGGGRTATARQQTLRGALDWSYDLLSVPERLLFCRLPVFASGWSLEAAEVAGADGIIDGRHVLDLISRLVDKSLVVVEAGVSGVLRYRFLEPVRQYATEKLEGRGEADAVRRRHALWFLAFAEEAEPELTGVHQGLWMERLEVEHDNLRASLRWFLERGEVEPALRICGALGEFWHMRGYLSEGRRWLEAALEEGAGPSDLRVKALSRAAFIGWEQGDYDRSTAFAKESLELSRRTGDKAGAALAHYNLGMAAMLPEEHWRAERMFGEAVALQRELGDAVGLARALQGLGLTMMAQGQFERAETLYKEGISLARQTGDILGIELLLLGQALAALGQDHYGRARVLCAEVLDLSRRLDLRHSSAASLHVLASAAGSEGQPVRAARLWGAAESLRESIGTTLAPVERTYYARHIAAARSRLDEEAWRAALAQGRRMTPEEAMEYGLPAKEPAPSTVPTARRRPRSRPDARAKALAQAGRIAWEQGDYGTAETLGEECLALSRELGDAAGIAEALYILGAIAMAQMQSERALNLLKETIALRRGLGDTAGFGRALQGLLQGLGIVEIGGRDLGRAQELHEAQYTWVKAFFDENLPLLRGLDDELAVSILLNNLGLVALHRGEHGRVKALCAEGLEVSRLTRSLHSTVFYLQLSAASAGSQGQPVRAARLWGAAGALLQTIGVPLHPIEHRHYGPSIAAPLPPGYHSLYETYLASAREQLGEEAWEATLREGRRMTSEVAVEYALSEVEEPNPSAALGAARQEADLEDPDARLSVRVKALARTAQIAWEQGDYGTAETLGKECLALSRELGDAAGIAEARYILGSVAMAQMQFERASAAFEEAATERRRLGDTVGLGRALQGLGMVELGRRDLGRAQQLYEESVALAEEAGDDYGVMLAFGLGAIAALYRDDHDQAGTRGAQGLRTSREGGFAHGVVFHLRILACLASSRGDPVRVARLWGAAEALGEKLGVPLHPVEVHRYGPYIDAARARFGEVAWEAALEDGRAMTFEGAAEHALSDDETAFSARQESLSGRRLDVLTPREHEVAVLLARGLSDRLVAEELSISERTVTTHVGKILRKLGFHSRAQVATWAVEQRLLTLDQG